MLLQFTSFIYNILLIFQKTPVSRMLPFLWLQMHNVIILLVYERETWSLILREGHVPVLKSLESEALWIIFEHKRPELTRRYTEMRNEQLSNFCSSSRTPKEPG
jgi:hypothetical protein